MLDFFTSDWVVMVRCLNSLTSDWIVMVTCLIFCSLIELSWSPAWIYDLWLDCHSHVLDSLTSDWIVMVTCLNLWPLIGLPWPRAWFSDLWLDCHGNVLDSLTSDWIAMTTRLSFIWQETSLSMFTFCRCTWSPWIDSIYWRVSTFLFPEERKHTVPFPVYIWLFLPRRNLGKFDILQYTHFSMLRKRKKTSLFSVYVSVVYSPPKKVFHFEEEEHIIPCTVYICFFLVL